MIPKEYIKPIEQGIREALDGGVLAGYQMVDIKVSLYDGSYHDVDSNEMAFKIAGSMAFKEAARKASPVLLEPVMAVEVTVPEEHMGTIIGDMNSRRGRIEGMEHVGGFAGHQGEGAAEGDVRLRERYAFIDAGTRDYSMQFARYEEAPRIGERRDHRPGAGQEAKQFRKLQRAGSKVRLNQRQRSLSNDRTEGREGQESWRRKSLIGRSRM